MTARYYLLAAAALWFTGCGGKTADDANTKKTDAGTKTPGGGSTVPGGNNASGSALPGDPFSRSLNLAQQAQLRNQLRQIGIANHNHHDARRAFAADGGSGKGLSWRVHLLPYLEHGALFKEFRLNEPWDSAHNRGLIARMPEIYNTPGSTNDGKTSFRVFVGKGAPFGGQAPLRMGDIVDGSSNTIMVVHAGAPVEWTKPGGLQFDPSNPTASFGGMPKQGLSVVFCDGAVRVLQPALDPKTLSLLIQHADRQQVPASF